MAYQGESNYTGSVGGGGGGTSKSVGTKKSIAGFNQTTTFVDISYPNNTLSGKFHQHTMQKTTTVSDGDKVIRGINTPI